MFSSDPFAQSPPGKASWIPGGKRGADLGACGDTQEHYGGRIGGSRGSHCPVPPSQAGRSPRSGPATAAGEAGGAALYN